MKHLKYISLILLMLSVGFSGVAFGIEVESKHKLKIAGDINYPPFEFMSEGDTNTYRGLNVDVMRALSIEMGIEIELIPLTWNEAKSALLEGRIDAIQGMTRTDSREILYDFSDSYHMSAQVIFVKSEVNDITDIEDLRGRVVALQRGDVNDELMSSFKGVKLNFYEDQESALLALLNGQADAVLGNRATGIYHLQRMKEIEKVKIVGETLLVNEYAVAVKNGDQETLKIINEGIRAIKAKGTLKKINEKWFGESIESQTRWKSLLIIASIISGCLFFMLGLIFIVNKKLQQEVMLRTKELQNSAEVIALNDAQKWHILNSISNGLIVFDINGKVSLFNQMSRDIIDKEIESGKHWSEIALCCRLGLELFENAFLSMNEFQGNIALVSQNQGTMHVHYSITPFEYDNGMQKELILMVHDNTQEKIFHDALYQNDKLSTLGKMSASIAHELRNPLNAIKQYIDIMPIKLENPNFMKQAMKILPAELNRLNDIIEGLLDYSKFSDSKRELVSVKELVDDLAMLMKVDFLYRRVKFSVDIEQHQLFVDPKQLKQVLINLLVNALDAIPQEGGIIQIASYQKDQFIIIEVQDNGIGISEAHLEKIFEPYYTTKPTGYGMGLAISKQLVEENGGSMWVESVINQGTAVKLKFGIYSE